MWNRFECFIAYAWKWCKICVFCIKDCAVTTVDATKISEAKERENGEKREKIKEAQQKQLITSLLIV